MSYELIILPHDWVTGPNEDGKRHEALTKIINKSYSKAANKFGIIKSTRIKNKSTFLNDFNITNDKSITLFVLLGPSEIFEKLKLDHGYTRNFDSPIDTIENSFNCDIPSKYLSYFEINDETEIDIKLAGPEFVLTKESMNRVMSTVGLKSYKDGTDLSPSTKNYELTAYTSFMRKFGPKALEIVTQKFLLNTSSSIVDHEGIEKFVIYAEVIKEHNLVEYYTENCGFTQQDKPDFLIECCNGEIAINPLEIGIIATQNFTLSYLYKEIIL